jgi:hypothetical protein
VNQEVTIQIFTGGFSEEIVSHEVVEQKLLAILSRLPVKKVIMGWSPDNALYEKTAELLLKRNIEFYLWFPVFSEACEVRKLGALVDYKNQRFNTRRDHGDESFIFCCPNNPENIEMILDIFESKFRSIPFSGVFLDRIRYPSFANRQGFEHEFKSVFSCFCKHCLDLYEKEKINIEQLKETFSHPNFAPLGITGYRGNGDYTFADPLLSVFFNLKADIIFRSLQRICGYFRERNYGIGFDVFAPFLSTFVGQDLKKLSGLCDFIKPMMYRATYAPAGMPFETEALLKEAGNADQTGFCKSLSLEQKKKPFDLDFAIRELQEMAASSACSVYAGVEINRQKNIVEVYPNYIEETIKAYAQTGVRGIALSWNLLDAPDENIAKAVDVIERINDHQ